MKNFKIIQTRPEIKNGWVVKADSKRFGEDAIMFEGNYEECWDYIQRVTFVNERDRVNVKVFGKRNDVELQGVTVRKYNDGFEHYPEYEFPNFVLPADIEKLNTFFRKQIAMCTNKEPLIDYIKKHPNTEYRIEEYPD